MLRVLAVPNTDYDSGSEEKSLEMKWSVGASASSIKSTSQDKWSGQISGGRERVMF